jgi:ribosome maturation protein SDO1
MVSIDSAVVARLKTHGSTFEVLVDCDKAIELREGKDLSAEDVLAVQKVFTDAKKGLYPPERQLEQVFGSTDPWEVAKQIIRKGEVQVTSEYRQGLAEQKRRRILEIIHRNGIDPRTKLPHPIQRLELAFEEAKVKIDEHKNAEGQIEHIVKQLRPVLPIHFEKALVQVHISPEHAGKAYSSVSAFGRIVKEDWQNDGSWLCSVEIPAGMQTDLFERVSKLTHGTADIKILKTEKGEI